MEAGRVVELALFTHVLGAMILVGGLLAGASLLTVARGDAALLRLGYWSLLAVALPGYIVMRIGAHWIYSEQGWDDVDEEPAWLGVGWVVADAGALLLLISLITGGIGVSRLRDGKGERLLKTALILSLVTLAAATVAVWAMSAKPD